MPVNSDKFGLAALLAFSFTCVRVIKLVCYPERKVKQEKIAALA